MAIVATTQERLNELFNSDPRSDSSIADALGVSKQAVSAWRNGTRSPKKDAYKKIAHLYNVQETWLYGYDVPKGENAVSFEILDAYAVEKLNMDEATLVESFREISDEGKQYLLQQAAIAKTIYGGAAK